MDSEDSEEEYTVERIIESRTTKSGKTEYLVAWEGYEDQTWEPAKEMKKTEAYKEWAKANESKSTKDKTPAAKKASKAAAKADESDNDSEYVDEDEESEEEGSEEEDGGEWKPQKKKKGGKAAAPATKSTPSTKAVASKQVTKRPIAEVRDTQLRAAASRAHCSPVVGAQLVGGRWTRTRP